MIRFFLSCLVVVVLAALWGGRENFTDSRIEEIVKDTLLMQQSQEAEALNNRYKCVLKIDDNMPSCILNLNENRSSIDQDVKCHILQQARTGKSILGSYVKSGSVLLDEGRLRSSPGDDLQTCEFLPTDSMLYPDVSQFPVCSKNNSLIYNDDFDDVVDIVEDSSQGRCKVKFKTTSRPKLMAYGNFLETQRATLENTAFQGQLRSITS